MEEELQMRRYEVEALRKFYQENCNKLELLDKANRRIDVAYRALKELALQGNDIARNALKEMFPR